MWKSVDMQTVLAGRQLRHPSRGRAACSPREGIIANILFEILGRRMCGIPPLPFTGRFSGKSKGLQWQPPLDRGWDTYLSRIVESVTVYLFHATGGTR